MTTHKNNTEATLKKWHDIIAAKDLASLKTIIHPDAVFRSPMAHTPYAGRDILVFALSSVIDIFEDFTYHREFTSEDGLNCVLEFSAHIGDKKLKGIDMIQFDEDGLITEFEVMIRPASALMALGERMAPHMMKLMGKN
ncbi:MAG: polyketide cyclase [Robiginitomaculum sp.]|nr:MAG: polyketide cyclase [Robiginitomaculum sp.]